MADVKSLTVRVDGVETPLTLTGRTAWALDNLMRAGERGCTPINNPAPRWSDYVFKLRRRGLAVETIDEKHGGTYAGEHARYVLRSPVVVLAEVRA